MSCHLRAVAGKLSLMLLGRPPKPSHSARNGRLVFYGFGFAFAASYGVSPRSPPWSPLVAVRAFGAAVWVAGDGMVTPWLGLAAPLFRQPAREAASTCTHILYGLEVAQVRALARR